MNAIIAAILLDSIFVCLALFTIAPYIAQGERRAAWWCAVAAVLFLVFQAGNAYAVEVDMTSGSGTAVGSLIIFITLVAGFVRQWLSEGRARKWAKEDAQAIAAKAVEDAQAVAVKAAEDAKAVAVKVSADAKAMAEKVGADAKAMATKVVKDAASIADKLHESAQSIAVKVEASANASSDALKGANSVNKKISDLNTQIVGLNKQLIELTKHVRKGDPKRRKEDRSSNKGKL